MLDEAIEFDPTDDHSAPGRTRITRLEWLDELREQQMQRGICSAGACHWPIAGWCVGCRAKLCADHLHEHRNLHARDARRATSRHV